MDEVYLSPLHQAQYILSVMGMQRDVAVNWHTSIQARVMPMYEYACIEACMHDI